MCKKSCFLISLIFVLALAANSYGQTMFDPPPATKLAPGDPDGGILVGDWEQCIDHWTYGWGSYMLGFSGTGATRNNTALKWYDATGNYGQALTIKLQDFKHSDYTVCDATPKQVDIFGYGGIGTGSSGQAFLDWFMNSNYNTFEIDVTDALTIPPPPDNPYNDLKLVLNTGGFKPPPDCNSNYVWYDAGNCTLVPGGTTRCSWDFSAGKAQHQTQILDAGFTNDVYVELFLITINNAIGGSLHLDNARLIVTPPGACNTNPGVFAPPPATKLPNGSILVTEPHVSAGPAMFDPPPATKLIPSDPLSYSILVGDWEGCMDHWTIAPNDPNSMAGYSATGATRNSNALEWYAPAGSGASQLFLKLQDYTHSDYTIFNPNPKDVDIFGYSGIGIGSSGQAFLDWFMAHCGYDTFEVDVTAIATMTLKFVLHTGGFDANGVENSIWYDCGNCTLTEVGTTHCSWDLSAGKTQTQDLFDAGFNIDKYVELFIINSGAGGTFYLDNARLTGVTCTTFIPGDINKDCYVDLYDFAIMAFDWLECNNRLDPDCNWQP